MDKATEFVKDLAERHVLGRVSGWCYSVEHQKRGSSSNFVRVPFLLVGMPHLHMLLILDKQRQITTPEQVDQFVSARIPSLPPMEDTSARANQQRRLWHYVTSMMLHDCNKACLKRRTINGKEVDVCQKNFPKPYSDHTVLSG